MFDKNGHGKTRWAPQPFQEDKLYVAKTSDQLLSEHSYQRMLELIRNSEQLSHHEFETYYKPLIEHFAEFVQVIPWREDEGLGGLLARGLESGYKVLQAINQSEQRYSRRFKFAAFSDALLHFLDVLVLNFRIMIHDATGRYIKRWQPLSGAMEPGTYYKIRPYSTTIRSNGTLRTLLARSVMPQHSFLFLAEELELLTAWLALMDEDREGSGGLMFLLRPIWARTSEAPKMLNAVKTEARETPATQEGERFWQWLKQSVQKGELTVNQKESLVHRVDEGVFLIYPQVFQEYARVFSRSIDEIVLYKQCNHLGLTKLSGYDYKFQQYFSTYPEVGGMTYSEEGGKEPVYEHMVPKEVLQDHEQAQKQKQSTSGQNKYSSQMTMAQNFLASLRQNKPPHLHQSGQPSQGQLKQGLIITDPGLVFNANQQPAPNQYFRPEPKPKS